MGLATLCTAVLEIGLLGRFVPTRDLRELPIVPDPCVAFALAVNPFHPCLATRADFLDLVFVMLVTMRTVRIKPAWHLHRYLPYGEVGHRCLKPVWFDVAHSSGFQARAV
jgi:hypothetical protein